jgi:hypothetical protein
MIIKLMVSPQICLCIYVNLTRWREPFSVLRMKEWQFLILGLSMFLFVFICTLFLWHTVIRWCHGLDWALKFRNSLKVSFEIWSKELFKFIFVLGCTSPRSTSCFKIQGSSESVRFLILMSSSTECGFWGSRVADLMESWSWLELKHILHAWGTTTSNLNKCNLHWCHYKTHYHKAQYFKALISYIAD